MLRSLALWVPDTRTEAFIRQAHEQSRAVAESDQAETDQSFVDESDDAAPWNRFADAHEWPRPAYYFRRWVLEALKAKDAKGAIRNQAEAIIETMNQLREQHNRAANETAIDH